jgi:hypothetical protein
LLPPNKNFFGISSSVVVSTFYWGRHTENCMHLKNNTVLRCGHLSSLQPMVIHSPPMGPPQPGGSWSGDEETRVPLADGLSWDSVQII